jgi:molecular chaperone GrpE
MTEEEKRDETPDFQKQEGPAEFEPEEDIQPAAGAGEDLDPVASLQGERDDLMGRLQRLGADYQNYQKRVQRDVSSAREYANEDLIRNLLPVLDDMERALQHARENHGEDDPLFKGTQMVHDKFLDVLGKFGVSEIHAEGETLDPEKHAAMMQQPTDEADPMTILQVVQKGYQLKGRTIRPAGVVVAAPPQGE